jgi:hypothetical protein
MPSIINKSSVMNYSEKEIFIRFLRNEIDLINARGKALKEECKDSFEANAVKDQLKNLEKALNEVEIKMSGLKRGEM